MLIVLTGIDGSGKTTAARALVESARAEGRDALLLSNHAGRRQLSLLAERFSLPLPPRVADFIETGVRLFTVLVNHARARRTDGLVVMDRHLHCQLALRESKGLEPGRLLPWLLRMLPTPDLAVHFDVDPRRAHQRVMARGIDKESLAELQAFRDAYRALPGFADFVVVDANGTPEEVRAQLNRLIAATEPVPFAHAGNEGRITSP
ncbi:thymidylate kinase [Arthrobacter sp. NtRootA4]|nr:thymidylate kinase [Arthrobacter sp. NtRootA2]BCW16204.1 thymidylate kinase [Arthrobacter sp. NtRootA4]BCW24536.1 thymidylate kinase [Arthrobacter sp. NtRootC7]BCW28805.1 thymidylate kinase [Arthrobacter sp. NtRootC45]BCW33076.1 thymidylate kinase [Arthrobacter sp. NtRootD5]